jgi:hypothetical protein
MAKWKQKTPTALVILSDAINILLHRLLCIPRRNSITLKKREIKFLAPLTQQFTVKNWSTYNASEAHAKGEIISQIMLRKMIPLGLSLTTLKNNEITNGQGQSYQGESIKVSPRPPGDFLLQGDFTMGRTRRGKETFELGRIVVGFEREKVFEVRNCEFSWLGSIEG